MGKDLAVGDKAPAFNLPRDGGGTVSLADLKGKKLVLYFYPRAGTPGCTREAIDFTRLRPQFSRAGTEIVGVSADPVKAQDAFKKKHKLTIDLLSDETHKMLEAYGAWGKNRCMARPSKEFYARQF
jgi:thioredoxin-dependent peroxiredoxin